MPRDGRPFWWPRCRHCGRWLSWQHAALLAQLDDPWRCPRCAMRRTLATLEER